MTRCRREVNEVAEIVGVTFRQVEERLTPLVVRLIPLLQTLLELCDNNGSEEAGTDKPIDG